MFDIHPGSLIAEAKRSVADASYSPKRLALIHTGIVAAAGVLISLLSYLLDMGIGNTGGLSGMGTRAILETAQAFLQTAYSVLTPFWALGFVAAAISLCRRREATPHTLTKGLRRFGPVVRMILLELVIYFAVIMVAGQIGSLLFSFTPWFTRLEEMVGSLDVADADYLEAVYAMMEGADGGVFLIMLLFVLAPMIALAVPIAYRLRFAQYLVMDDPKCGAFAAVIGSFHMTKGNCMSLLKIDLRYWWFYGLELLVSVLSMGDLLLPLFGIPLNMGIETASTLFYLLALGCQLALYAWKKPQVFTTYALLYDGLLPKEQETV